MSLNQNSGISEKSAMNNHLILKRNLCMDPSQVLSHKSINIFGSVPLFVSLVTIEKRTALFLRLCASKDKMHFPDDFLFHNCFAALWQYRLFRFQGRDTISERFLAKNQQTQRKLFNFENWSNGELSKIGHLFRK